MDNVIILGAAGRDFHNFNTVFRDAGDYRVVCFTATQIPNIEGRTYPAGLAGPLYPDGIPIEPEDRLEDLIRDHAVTQVIFSYSDVSHETVMHLASRALACGADFRLLGDHRTMIASSKPVIAVTATRTGCGKSQTSRRIAHLLRERGLRVAAVRHPMPYGDLAKQAVQRFAALEDLDTHHCTIEEREEYEHYIEQGLVVFAGVDYAGILAAAEAEADVILWDGGNNDTPFYRPDLDIVVVDPLRPGHELSYHPGEANLRRAGVVVINKVDSAAEEVVDALAARITRVNPRATQIRADSVVTLEDSALLAGTRVLVVEDGPTVTHGGMAWGAGTVAARQAGVAEIVDPRPAAVGSIKEAYARYPHMERILPALGYYAEQLEELRQSIQGVDCDHVIVGTPVDLRRFVHFDKPAHRVTYRLQERPGEPTVASLLDRLLAG
ncbi:MAG: cyclic 2,3-diphosphoglycerate synthase [Pseudomonadota bacterium]